MKTSIKKIVAFGIIAILTFMLCSQVAFAASEQDMSLDTGVSGATDANDAVDANNAADASEAESDDSSIGKKAFAAAICVCVVASAAAIGMAVAISKSADGISRQPEAAGSIRTSLMLGLVFIETAIIYALIISILIIFVL